MSATRQSRFVRFLAYYVVPCCFGGCAFAFYDDKDLTGWGLLITGLLVQLIVMLDAQQRALQKEPEPPPIEEDEVEDDGFRLDLTTPELAKVSGDRKSTRLNSSHLGIS